MMLSAFIALMCFLPYITAQNSTILYSKSRWLQLPPTPKLPLQLIGQYAKINDIGIWYTIYGSNNATSLLFLHGGFANSNYWGLQVEELKSFYRCILMDSRGQGRSFTTSTDITYDLMTSDVIALLDYLNIERVHLVGWSDGAIIGLNLAMNHPNRLISLFAFGANYGPTGVKDVSTSPVFMTYLERTKTEYEAMNPVNNYSNLYNNLTSMWAKFPNWTQQDFTRIDKKLSIWIVDGDHEEAIFRNQPDDMTSWIPQASQLILPGTSHFAFIQDPITFTMFVKRFLTEIDCPSCTDTIWVPSVASSLFNARTLAQPAGTSPILVYVGTYTGKSENDSKGIYAFAFDSKDSSLKPLGLVAVTQNPTYVLMHPSRRYILSVNEAEKGQVNAFKINSIQTAELIFINQQSSGGSYPIYLSSDALGHYIFVANYISGTVAVLPFDTNYGRIQDSTGIYQQNGSSIDPESQTSSHPHCILLDKKEEYAISADLGSDELYVYRFISTNGTLKKQYISKSRQPGDGPRHLIFNNNQKYVYVINELSSSITVFTYYPILRAIQTISTLPQNFTSINYAAELLVHPVSNKFLYASNRGHDSIVVFAIDNATGYLNIIQHVHVQGRTPRHFNILPDGAHLIVANQDSNNLVVFSINTTTGMLTVTDSSVQVSKPTSVAFLIP
ncbi:unnamed protein product [Rotaria sp. Silwood1]|nr:unnamed protein product [Rotaria sp. Silwood1]